MHLQGGYSHMYTEYIFYFRSPVVRIPPYRGLVQPHNAKAISTRESLLPRVENLSVQQRASNPLIGHLLRVLAAVYFENNAVSG